MNNSRGILPKQGAPYALEGGGGGGGELANIPIVGVDVRPMAFESREAVE